MRKLVVFPFVFLLSVHGFAEEKTLLFGNFSETEHFGINTKFFSFDTSLTVNNLLSAQGTGYLNTGQTFKSSQLSQSYNHPCFLQTFFSNSKNQKREKPPLSGGRIVGEILAGAAGEIVGGTIGVIISAAIVSDYDLVEGTGFQGIVLAGWVIGSSAGVYLIGNIRDQTGSPIITLSGSILGTVAGVSIFYNEPGKGLLFFPPIGATIGFNTTRRYDSPTTSGNAIINYKNGQMSFAAPTIYFRPNPVDEGRTLVKNIDLLRLDF